MGLLLIYKVDTIGFRKQKLPWLHNSGVVVLQTKEQDKWKVFIYF